MPCIVWDANLAADKTKTTSCSGTLPGGLDTSFMKNGHSLPYCWPHHMFPWLWLWNNQASIHEDQSQLGRHCWGTLTLMTSVLFSVLLQWHIRFQTFFSYALFCHQLVENSSSESHFNIPQLVRIADGRVLVKTFNWQKDPSPYFWRLPQNKSYQHFRYVYWNLNIVYI